MADEQDKSQKTEDPTQRRLDEAEAKGQVPKSNEVNHLFMLVAIALSLVLFGSHMVRGVGGAMLPFLEAPHAIASDMSHLRVVTDKLARELLFLIGPILGLVLVAALAGNMVQHRLVFSAENLAPKFSKISPLQGFQKLVSLRNLFEFGKSLVKLAIVGTVVMVVLWPEKEKLPQLITVDMMALLEIVQDLSLRLLIGVVAVMLIIAIADFLYQRYTHRRDLRMSKQEIKDENKQSEGDPQIKARIRGLRLERSRQRMMAAVPKADVVVTNPTHYAIALQYDAAEMAAPKLVAKGVDHLAARIRELARENGVPIVENPPLARAIYATVEVNHEIPGEHYKAVAEIIGYVMKLKGEAARRRFTAAPRSGPKRPAAAPTVDISRLGKGASASARNAPRT